MVYQLDFSEVQAPTGKQIDLVQAISRVLHVPVPEDYTFETYSAFIGNHIERYKDELWYNGGEN